MKFCKFILILGSCLSVGLLTSCGFFRAKEIGVDKRTSVETRDYYNLASGKADELSFETRNFLSSNLMRSDYRDRPNILVRKLAGMYEKEPSRLMLSILSNVCSCLAVKTDDEEQAVKYDLAAAYYSYQLLFDPKITAAAPGKFDPSVNLAMRTYNQALSRLYSYLARHRLLRSCSFQLTSADGKIFTFGQPRYELVYKPGSYLKFLLCSDYKPENLSHFTHEFGVGTPVIAVTNMKTPYQSLKSEAPIVHGATAFLRFEAQDKNGMIPVRMEFYDYDRIRSIKVGREKAVPLSFDYTTPFAYYVSTLPDLNLIEYMLNPAKDSTAPGLYTLEPYYPDKIPVVLVHGLMSSVHTWMQMVNTLKNDPLIRKHCQFWFFTYSSGNPLLYSAGLLRKSLNRAHDELAKTPEAKKMLGKMVIVGHSMGGLISKTLIEDPGDILIRKIIGSSWEELQPKCTEYQQELIRDYVMFKSVPYVRRMLFLAVPHRGSAMAQYSIAHLGSKLVSLPGNMVVQTGELAKRVFTGQEKNKNPLAKLPTGIDGLDPNSRGLQILNELPFRPGVPCHSIIGNKDAADVPGGSDGVVPYSSSHLDNVESELIVRSGHSVQQNPAAIREVRRILRLHLQKELGVR